MTALSPIATPGLKYYIDPRTEMAEAVTGTVIIQPGEGTEKDTFLRSGPNQDTMFGIYSSMRLGFGSAIDRLLLQYTLPEPLEHDNLLSAVLTLNVYRVFGSGPSNGYFRRCDQSLWNEHQATWNQFREDLGGGLPYLWDTSGGDTGIPPSNPCSFVIPNSAGLWEIEGYVDSFNTTLLAYCEDAIAYRNRELILLGRRSDEATGYHEVTCRTGEFGYAPSRPYLTIEYATPALLRYQRTHRGFYRGGIRGHI